jgi:carboxyl-terminal processing protease
MQIASNRLAGALTATPDVCLTPPVPVPVPYFNTAFTATAVSFVPNVILSGGNALNLGTILAVSTGDEPGVAHWTIKGPATFTMGCPIVLLAGLPAIALTSTGMSNTGNAPVGAVTIPSATNVFFAYGGDASSAPVTLDEVRQIEESVSGSADTVSGAMRADGVGLIAIRVFSSGVPARVHGLVRRFEQQGLRALILDLRGNPGGEVTAMVELAGDFLEPGSVVLTMVDADGDETVYRARGERPYRFPVAVLVDGDTASAAELFAGSLQAHGRALVVGEATFGKGVGQRLVPRLDGAGIERVTAARYVLPDGQQIQGEGVQPQIAWPG